MAWPGLSWNHLWPCLSHFAQWVFLQTGDTSQQHQQERRLPQAGFKKVLGRFSEMRFSLNFTLPTNTVTTAVPFLQTSSPVVTSGKAADCGPSIGLAAGIPSLVATALLVALLLTLIQRRRNSSEPMEESEIPCEISEIYDNPKISENPRRSPPREMSTMDAQEAHIYVKTVARSEEPPRDIFRPPEERERRGLWWLIPRLSLE